MALLGSHTVVCVFPVWAVSRWRGRSYKVDVFHLDRMGSGYLRSSIVSFSPKQQLPLGLVMIPLHSMHHRSAHLFKKRLSLF